MLFLEDLLRGGDGGRPDGDATLEGGLPDTGDGTLEGDDWDRPLIAVRKVRFGDIAAREGADLLYWENIIEGGGGGVGTVVGNFVNDSTLLVGDGVFLWTRIRVSVGDIGKYSMTDSSSSSSSSLSVDRFFLHRTIRLVFQRS